MDDASELEYAGFRIRVWASITARRHPRLSVRCEGTGRNVRHRISGADLAWADGIASLKEMHTTRLLA